MKCILPLCFNPDVKAYVHHMFLHMIMQNENNIGKDLFKLRVIDYSKYEWKKTLNETSLSVYDDDIVISAEKYAKNTENIIVRKCKSEDEIIMNIKYHQYTNPDSIINIILCDNDLQRCLEKDTNIIRFGIVRHGGMFIKKNDKYLRIDNHSYNREEYKWLRLKLCLDRVVQIYISKDDITWEMIKEIDLSSEFDMSNLVIGFNTNAGENQYDNWLYPNYLQICSLDNMDDLTVDYYNYPIKSYSSFTIHNFFEFNKVTFKFLLDNNIEISEYIQNEINNEKYVIITLNEYYVEGSLYYHEIDFYHPCMVYGYDDETFFVTDFNNKVIEGCIYKANLKQAINENSTYSNYMRSIQYLPNLMKYNFDLAFFYKSICDFINGKNTSLYFHNILPLQKGCFGLEVFHKLLETEDGREKVTNDYRVSYVIYEFNYLMKKRMEFLYKRKIITYDEYTLLENKCIPICDEMQLIMKRVILNIHSKKYSEKILLKLSDVFQKEKDFFFDLKNIIESKMEK